MTVGCVFCGGDGMSWFVHCSEPIADPLSPNFWHTPDAFGRYCGVVALCAEHERILRAAGKAGQRHARTGVRWWLGIE